ncbi:MAG: hypothetical protein SF187_10950 [Deltaproteobacteria bacterium]|nr:hypothetical protein [Deltaproteobacteria bacterium]
MLRRRLFAVGVSFLVVLVVSRRAHAAAVKLAEDRCRYDEGTKSWQVTIPNTAAPVRGLFVNGNPGTGDLLNWTMNPFFRSYFAARFGFGMVASKGVEGSSTFNTNAPLIIKAIEECGKTLAHPELAWAPLIPLGNSSGGTNSWGLTMSNPNRILAFVVNIPGTTLNPGTPPEAALQIPGMIVVGQNDGGNLSTGNGAMLRAARTKGALWSKVEMEGIGHENRRSWHMFHVFFEHIIARRLPADADPSKGPVKLLPIAEDSGYVADDTTWASGLTKFSPYADFAGNKRGPDTSWLLDEDVAFLHQGYSSRGRLFDITTADLPAGTDGGTIIPLELNTNLVTRNFNGMVELLGTAKDPSWTKIELYRGAKKIDEITGGGATFKFTIPINADPPAVWAFSVRGRVAAGVRPSQMLSVLVKPNTGQGASGAGGMMGGTGGGGGSPAMAGGAGGTGGTGGASSEGGSNVAGAGGEPADTNGGQGGSGSEEPSATEKAASGCRFASRGSSPAAALLAIFLVMLRGRGSRRR